MKARQLVSVTILVIGIFVLATTTALAQSVERGEKLYKQERESIDINGEVGQGSCSGCHGEVGGENGRIVGPDLQWATERHTRKWLIDWIRNPTKMFEERDPIAMKMKEIGAYPRDMITLQGLTEEDVLDILAYIEEESERTPVTPWEEYKTMADEYKRGNENLVEEGRMYFTGYKRFEKAGRPCLACHAFGGIGALGGGQMGKDLTYAYFKFQRGLLAYPQAIPPMEPIYGKGRRSLTDHEEKALLAFLQTGTIRQRSPEKIGLLAGLSFGGLIVIFLLLHVVWKDRLTEVRRPMIGKRADISPRR